MNILYYIPDLHQGMGGLRQYAIAMLKLLSGDTEHRYFIYHKGTDPEVANLLKCSPHLHALGQSSVLENGYPLKIRDRIRRVNARLMNQPVKDNRLQKVCRKYRIDIIHCPYQYHTSIPGVRSICTMHDVQELHFPEFFSAEDRAYRAVNYLKYIREASAIIVSYEHIKKDIINYFQVPKSKIHVCLLNMSNLWLDKLTDADILSVPDLKVPEQFLLYPANTWPHKNHLLLMEAIVLLREQGETINMVFTGHQTPYYHEVLLPYIKKNALSDQVKFLGVVSEQVLYSLYNNCVGVVIPTLYEAGSFPLMEAMLLSVPVICSNVTSLPETIGEEEFIFNPQTSAGISSCLTQIWNDEDFRRRSRINSANQAYKIKNASAIELVKAVYYSLLV